MAVYMVGGLATKAPAHPCSPSPSVLPSPSPLLPSVIPCPTSPCLPRPFPSLPLLSPASSCFANTCTLLERAISSNTAPRDDSDFTVRPFPGDTLSTIRQTCPAPVGGQAAATTRRDGDSVVNELEAVELMPLHRAAPHGPTEKCQSPTRATMATSKLGHTT